MKSRIQVRVKTAWSGTTLRLRQGRSRRQCNSDAEGQHVTVVQARRQFVYLRQHGNRARMPGYDANVVLNAAFRSGLIFLKSGQGRNRARLTGKVVDLWVRCLTRTRQVRKRFVSMSVFQSSFGARSCLFSPARTCTDVVGLVTSESCLSGLSGGPRPARWREPHRSTPQLAGKEQLATPSFRIDLSSRTAFCAVTSTSKTALGSTAS
jgi:hypothetical protein